MAADPSPHVVVMGVSGSGKTTVAARLAHELGWPFADADDLHAPESRALMASGVPLSEELRWPWLADVRGWLDSQHDQGLRGVVACSALRRSYRDVLAGARGGAFFVHLDIPEGVLARRLEARQGHFMPPSLLTSQLVLLEAPGPDEYGAVVDGDAEVAEVVERARGAVPRA